MAIQRLPGDPKFLAKGADFGFLLTHGGHGQADLGRRHLERAPTGPASRPRRGEPGDGTLRDECSLELSESSEDPEYELAGCGRGVNGRTLTCKNFETDTAVSQIMNGVNQVTEVTAEPVDLPNQVSVPLTECLQAGRQVRAVVFTARRLVLVEVVRLYAGSQERVSLEIGTLRPVSLRYPHVSDEHA